MSIIRAWHFLWSVASTLKTFQRSHVGCVAFKLSHCEREKQWSCWRIDPRWWRDLSVTSVFLKAGGRRGNGFVISLCLLGGLHAHAQRGIGHTWVGSARRCCPCVGCGWKRWCRFCHSSHTRVCGPCPRANGADHDWQHLARITGSPSSCGPPDRFSPNTLASLELPHTHSVVVVMRKYVA